MKQEIKDIIYINELLEFYGILLTKKQQDIMRDYYLYNLSFSEISLNHKISKAAVGDTIEKSIKKLNFYENNLQYHQIFQDIKKNADENKLKIIAEIEEEFKHGI